MPLVPPQPCAVLETVVVTDPNPALVPGRECGACTACCRELTIESDVLRKVQGVLCAHCMPGRGCGIHASRPDVCRDWFCQWRRFAWLDDSWRPDRSGLLLRATDDDVPEGYASGIGVVIDVLDGCDRLLRPEVMAVIAGLVDAGLAIFLSVPSLAGLTSGRVLLNPSLEDAVRARDGDVVRARLVDTFLMSALHPKQAIVV